MSFSHRFVNLKVTQLLIGLTVRFSQSKVVLNSNASRPRKIWRKKTMNVLNPFLNKPWFLHVCGTSLLKTLGEKEKSLIMSNFSFSYSVFYPFGEHSLNLKRHLQTLWKNLKFAVWERFKNGL